MLVRLLWRRRYGLVFRLATPKYVGLEEEVDEEDQIRRVHEHRQNEDVVLEITGHLKRHVEWNSPKGCHPMNTYPSDVDEVTDMSEDNAWDDELEDLDRRDELGDDTRNTDLHRAQEVVAEKWAIRTTEAE